MVRISIVSCVLFALSGCAFDLASLQANPVLDDGGAMPVDDGGFPSLDDAQVLPDGGEMADAGIPDSGMVETPDAGETPDSGVCVGACREAVDIAAGRNFSCAVYASGEMACWGGNSAGQLGDGTRSDSVTPRLVPGISDAAAVATYDAGTCVLHMGGTVSCWGQTQDTTLELSPVVMPGLSGVDEIAGNAWQMCAIASGQVWCWEYMRGEARATPTLVPGISDAVEVGVGSHHICARLSGGQVFCWGYNSFGQLGDGTIMNRTTPGPVMGIFDATQLSVGRGHSCAILSSGSTLCWGLNGRGQIGNGSTFTASTPQPVAGLSNAAYIVAGNEGTCAIRDTGSVMCWGENDEGQIGDGDLSVAMRTRLNAPVTGLSDADSLAAHDHVCAIRTTGQIVCWGLNEAGQLGDGTTDDRSTPVTLAPPT